MRRPNFFIVGAPKCGTTALAQYLAENPRVFMPIPKEPNYFARHLTADPAALNTTNHHTSVEHYLALFQGARDRHLAVGEASTRYLRSRRALRALREFRPDARILVMLRNPVDQVYSWHSQKVYDGQETEHNFEVAWRLQAERVKGRRLPKRLFASDALHYYKIGSLGTQLEFLLQLFPQEQVRVLFYDDFRKDTRREYEKVLNFLGVESDSRSEFPVVNAPRRLRHPALARLLSWRPVALRRAVPRVHRALGVHELGVSRMIHRVVGKPYERPALDSSFRRKLLVTFESEIRKLESLTGRDLDGWRS